MSRRSWYFAVALVALVWSNAPGEEAGRQNPPMVISWSWSCPDARYLKLHAEEWDQLPFTGTKVSATWPQQEAGSVRSEGNDPDSLSWSVFRKTRFTEEMLAGSLRDFKETKLTHSTNNFLSVQANLGKEGGHFDWYDDAWWETVLHNIEGMARVAREGGLSGIIMDVEEYGCRFWGWDPPDGRAWALARNTFYEGKTWEQTRDLVRARGRSFIAAINKSYPGIILWNLYGYSRIDLHPKGDPNDMSKSVNGLYAAFLDGMIEASDEKTIFIDGGEGSYRFTKVEQFEGLRRQGLEEALSYTMVPKEVYQKKVRMGFGIYMDMHHYRPEDKDSHPWYGDSPQDNYRTPADLKWAVETALAVGDGYVWIYSEYPSWWLDSADDTLGEGVRSRDDHKWIHPSYHRAIEQAMQGEKTSLRVPEGFRATEGASAEPYTDTKWAQEVLHTKSGIEMVFVPAGAFRMGSDSGDPDERPAHHVKITRPFYMGKYEVKVSEFRAFVEDTGHKTQAENAGKDANWRDAGFPQTEQDPVVYVSWGDASTFCRWAGLEFPTEANWEYACRAGTMTPFHSGRTISTDQTNCNGQPTYGNPRPGVYRRKTVAVGTFPPNAWGLHDMHGNVWEWCGDFFDEQYYSTSPLEDPPGPSSGPYHVLRGGSWRNLPIVCSSANRHFFYPSYVDDRTGFRVALGPLKNE